jgi:sterol-4alpha-carboxylate 3-dehydrogenase (decarboxylating)
MIGDGKNLADFTFIDNVVYAHYLAAIKLAPNSKVSGQAYFITNDEPTPFWSFVGRLLNEFGSPKPQRSISYAFAYFLAWFMEYLLWFAWSQRIIILAAKKLSEIWDILQLFLWRKDFR